MRRDWLGDALDFWKGSFLDVLRMPAPSEASLQILPMFTDVGWTTAEVETYARVLGVQVRGILTTMRFTHSGRRDYFAAARQEVHGDVFVDPDTGLAPSTPKAQHVTASEAASLLTSDNVVATYQHRPQRVSAPWLERYKALLPTSELATIAYESAQAGMVFVTKSTKREAEVRQALESRLGASARPRGVFPGRMI